MATPSNLSIENASQSNIGSGTCNSVHENCELCYESLTEMK